MSVDAGVRGLHRKVTYGTGAGLRLSMLTVPLTLALSSQAEAVTLQEALVHAYQTNPQLLAGREQLRVTNEQYPQAIAEWLPSVSTSSSAGRTISRTDQNGYTMSTTQTFNNSVSLSQTLYKGGQNFAGLRSAAATIDNQRVTLAKTEQTVLLAAITAYMNLIRDYETRKARAKNVEVLKERLETTQVQFDLGQKTRADLAQAQSRLASAEADLTTSESTVNNSEASFQRVIGLDPKDLVFPTFEQTLPKSVEEAVEQAITENLDVRAGEHSVRIAEASLSSTQGTRLPTLAISTSYSRNRTGTRGTTSDSTETSVAGSITLTVPIYQNGSELSKVRAAKKTILQRKLELDNLRLAAKESAIQAWGNLVNSRAKVNSQKRQVDAATVARTNVEAELQIGRRTVLNLLDAEKELLDAEVNLISSQRDVVVFAYTLLGNLGKLSAENLSLPVEIFNPEKDFNDQKFNLFTTGID